MAERGDTERSGAERPASFHFGPYRFDRANQVLSLNGSELPLPPRALKVLGYLLKHPGEVVSKQVLVDEVWNGTAVTDNSLSEVVRILRQTLGDDPQNAKYIQTLHGRGFRFVAPVSAETPSHREETAPLGVGTEESLEKQTSPSTRTPHRRSRDMADVRREIQEARGEPTTVSSMEVASAAQPARRGRAIPWSLAGAAAVIAGVAVWSLTHWSLTHPAPPTLTKFVITPPPNAPLVDISSIDLAISPDGRRIVYVADRGESTQLHVRPLDELEVTPLPGTEGAASFPFFSPDGEWVGFFANGELKKVSLTGGRAIMICDAGSQWGGGGWTPQDTIVFSAARPGDSTRRLYRVSAVGGTPEVIAIPATEKGERSYACPKILPGGSSVLFDVWRVGQEVNGALQFGHGQIRALSLETGQQKIVVEKANNAYYVPTGYLLYHDLSSRHPSLMGYEVVSALFAAPFDLASLEVTGDAVPILAGTRGVDVAVSGEGTLVYVPGIGRQKTLVWVDRYGTERVAMKGERNYGPFKISPDGTRVAVTITDDGWKRNVWIYDSEEDWLNQLTFEGEQNVSPVWTPDGKWVIFSSDRDGPSNLYRQRADGSGPAERLTTSEFPQRAGSSSPDGTALLFHERTRKSRMDIGVLEMDVDGKSRPFIASPKSEYLPSFSPDGQWLAFVLGARNPASVYVSAYPEPDVKWLVSGEHDSRMPIWSPDGTELFYRSGDKMMVVPIQTRPSFKAGKPRVLFDGFPIVGYDISPDGQRFLMTKRPGVEGINVKAGQINVVLNWSQEVDRRVRVRRGQ